MIRWLSKIDWKDYIENRTQLGKYISHSLFNADRIEPAANKYNFSSAIIKVTFEENETGEIIDLYFDNSGPIKFESDTYELENQSVEFNFLYHQPYMVSEIMQFVEMMSEKFGETYRIRRILHAYNEIKLIDEEYKLILSDLHEKYLIFGAIKTDMSNLISNEVLNIKFKKGNSKFPKVFSESNAFYNDSSLFDYTDQLPYPMKGKAKNISRTESDQLIDFVIHEEVKSLIEEKDFMEDYKYYQESLINYIQYISTKVKDSQDEMLESQH